MAFVIHWSCLLYYAVYVLGFCMRNYPCYLISVIEWSDGTARKFR
ncbi:hypothetical protein SLEP1_g41631 [Rubroshorea leprosula]|uniref:Uncharacterized protein n=1 Tax=Rubroshorea leprosula TaxID=152421 RepID=A0AAV5L820_9ROSI|nr:hypothetical protein SLEP1_g41631 [Rubroshorea leprosula]